MIINQVYIEMYRSGKATIKGRIIAIRSGEKQVRRGYTYGYMIISVQVEADTYSVLVDTSKINKYGFYQELGTI